jgi:hypothetical protein
MMSFMAKSVAMNKTMNVAMNQIGAGGSQLYSKFKMNLLNCSMFFIFVGMWYQIFLYDLATSVFIHCIVALLSFCSLRRHKYGRFFPVFVIIVGFMFPVTGGVITSRSST